MVRWSIEADERGGGFTVLDFVEACYLEGPPNDDERIAVRGLSSKFRPVLVDRSPGSYRRVWHHRFGSGFVLREYNDGNHKVEVDFPGAGTKLLLASYVRDAAPVPPKKGGGRRTTPAISGARAR
jgi:hypothetical protein